MHTRIIGEHFFIMRFKIRLNDLYEYQMYRTQLMRTNIKQFKRFANLFIRMSNNIHLPIAYSLQKSFNSISIQNPFDNFEILKRI